MATIIWPSDPEAVRQGRAAFALSGVEQTLTWTAMFSESKLGGAGSGRERGGGAIILSPCQGLFQAAHLLLLLLVVVVVVVVVLVVALR